MRFGKGFGRDRTVISRHVNNCFKEGELDPNITCAKFAHVEDEGTVKNNS